MKELVIATISAVGIIAIIVSAVCALSCISENHDREEYTPLYNNGIHADCGGHWHIVAQGDYSYTYECDKCGTTFRSMARMK